MSKKRNYFIKRDLDKWKDDNKMRLLDQMEYSKYASIVDSMRVEFEKIYFPENYPDSLENVLIDSTKTVVDSLIENALD